MTKRISLSARRLGAVPLALALGLAACGQTDDGGGGMGQPELDGGDQAEADTEAEGDELVIGRISALEGAFAAGAEDGERGVQMALEEFGHEVAGRPIRTIVESSDTTPETVVERARKLVEQDGVDIIHGPLSGSEGVALADYAKTVPHVTFVDAASGGTETTLRDPAENYFRWHSDGAMWTAPMGPYAVEELGYDRVVTLAEDYSFPHSQVGGFLNGYCAAGGEVAETFWVPLGESDYSSVIASIPEDIDAIYVALGGSDAVDFLSQAINFGIDKPIIGGSILVEETVLSSEGQIRDAALGTVASGVVPPPAADVAGWQDFVSRYQEMFPNGFDNPSHFAALYYNGFKALLLALEEVNGVVEEDDGEALRAAMSDLQWDSPIGPLALNENRQAEGDVFIYEVVEGDDGGLTTELRDVGEDIPQPEVVWERLDGCPAP
ncbi:amino acid/amide ABC transporter substrate-binding protein (HAAT family) [Haloactinopolyspora alba]|uniref:Amino acid/amide ABC transporter substrate-binding protein (HAAT family) n=1 Tax=Haloactinopolyspora alba TaxID=648780 RepID=A0A2P8E029_9ACTN|nr:ABC transporter substrate-binding protein [Haloactinopolyspora alba]PSL02767.1 amino acid/amide ABC transporter substrate-binding protein (HAAT family) [Haloactinopolyspora alba]